jgi:hypothetical protein
MQDRTQDLILATVVIAMSSLHLIYAFRTGKVMMGSSWRMSRAESPVSFWSTVIVTILLLAGGLYVAIFGLPDRPDL